MRSQPPSALTPFGWLLLAVLLRAVNQVLIKFFALDWGNTFIDLGTLAMLGSIGLILIARSFCWQRALSELPLSVAYPFFALTLITLMGSGYFIFGEHITIINLAGVSMISAGIFIIATCYETETEQ